MSHFYVEYSVGPRYIDGVNIDEDANATTEMYLNIFNKDEPD